MISGILIAIVMAIAAIMAFFVVVAMTITSVTCGYEQDREREAESPREFWLLLSLLVGSILIILVLFITLIWSFFVKVVGRCFYLDNQEIILYSKSPRFDL